MSAASSTKDQSTKAFAKRLNQACDDSPDIPELGKGRQVVVASLMSVSQEAARKWFSGDAKPKGDKMSKLATLLRVDEAWLALGVKPELSKDAKRFAARAAEGAVLVVAGSIQLAGGNCAFPAEDDPRAEYVDIYAIVRGRKLDLHVCTAREIEPNVFELIVPRQYKDVRCIGYFPARSVMFNLIDLQPELIDKHKVGRAGDFSLTITRDDGRYITGTDEWPKLKGAGGII